MITLLSPSKGQDFECPTCTDAYTMPRLLSHSELLLADLRSYDTQALQKLMGVSERIAELNVQRFKKFTLPFTPQNSKQALCAFTGDVYGAMEVEQYSPADFEYAQGHLRILSGLYGCLRPLDLIQPYRLEMKTKMTNKRGDNLYEFWGQHITEEINRDLIEQDVQVVVNLASQEYFKAVNKKKLAGELLNIVFKEIKDAKVRVVAIFAKRARGMMADFIIRQKIDNPEDLKGFTSSGYRYDEASSEKDLLTFVRQQPS